MAMAFSNAFESWRDAVDEEDKTFCIQQVRLPYKFGNLSSMLDVHPYASVLIFDSKLEKSLALNNPNGIKEKLLEDLKKDAPSKAIVLKVDECLTTEEVDFEGIASEQTDGCGLLGLFLSSVEQRAPRVSIVCKSAINSRNVELVNDVADRLADELGLNDHCESSKSILLLFAAPFQPAAAALIYELRNRVKNDEETVWIGEVGDTLAAANCYGSHRRNEQIIVALRITEPGVESWSACVDLRLPRDEVERQLHELKKRVTLKRFCSALLSAPCETAYGSAREIMRSVKRIFPGVPFVGLFDSHEYTVSASRTHLRICKKDIFITDCSLSDPPKLGIDKYRYLSLIIMTYN